MEGGNRSVIEKLWISESSTNFEVCKGCLILHKLLNLQYVGLFMQILRESFQQNTYGSERQYLLIYGYSDRQKEMCNFFLAQVCIFSHEIVNKTNKSCQSVIIFSHFFSVGQMVTSSA